MRIDFCPSQSALSAGEATLNATAVRWCRLGKVFYRSVIVLVTKTFPVNTKIWTKRHQEPNDQFCLNLFLAV